MKYHFVGIKGVGMTAAALCLIDQGHTVQGSDIPDHFVTEKRLQEAGVTIYTSFEPENITNDIDFSHLLGRTSRKSKSRSTAGSYFAYSNTISGRVNWKANERQDWHFYMWSWW